MTQIPNIASRWKFLCAGGLLLLIATTNAFSQTVVLMVNGDPITALDIEQRGKLNALSSNKTPPRQEIIDELVNEKLKIKEGKRWGLEITDADVDAAFASMGSKMKLANGDQFAQFLATKGIYPGTLKSRIRAEIVWQQLVRGRYQSSLQVGEKDILTALENKQSDQQEGVSFDYTMRPILFLLPPGSAEAAIEGRRREADALRARFKSCEEGLPFARALQAVAVRDQITRNSSDIPPELRKVLDGVPVGSLTAPEVTKLGVEMFAICGKKESHADNAPGKRQAREAVFNERFEQQSKRYLQELRKGAWIERR
jgi:peptidyl-prolyl cis-trans isomerase SurA